jgi:hypothetical protein
VALTDAWLLLLRVETKRLGQSDLNIPPIGVGSWAVGGSGWGFAWGDRQWKLRNRVSDCLDAKGSAPSVHQRLRNRSRIAVNQFGKEIYRLAIRNGHANEDFSAI